MNKLTVIIKYPDSLHEVHAVVTAATEGVTNLNSFTSPKSNTISLKLGSDISDCAPTKQILCNMCSMGGMLIGSAHFQVGG